MKQQIKLILNGNQVYSATKYIYTPDTEVEIVKDNFTETDVIIKNNGIQEGAFVLQCVNVLVNPPMLNEIKIPIKFKDGLEKAFDDLFNEIHELKEELNEKAKILETLVDNLEG